MGGAEIRDVDGKLIGKCTLETPVEAKPKEEPVEAKPK
jgi:hypothetical protein